MKPPELIRDPMERLVAEALVKKGWEYIHDSEGGTIRLDFYLPHLNMYIEVKRFHSDRIDEQIKYVSNVIVLQGEVGIRNFCALLEGRL